MKISHGRSHSISHIIFVTCCFASLSPFSMQEASALSNVEEEARSFVEAVAEMTYFAAWPSATFEDASIISWGRVHNGYDVWVKFSGTSWFGGVLWMELKLEVRDGELYDVQVTDHNAKILPPFTTTAATGQLIAEIAEEMEANNETSGFRFFFTNKCQHPLKLAIYYKTLDGVWKAVGWWTFDAHESAYLESSGEYLRTNSATVYYYAETEDRRLAWRGNGRDVNLGGRVLSMVRLEDKSGDTNWSLSCEAESH